MEKQRILVFLWLMMMVWATWFLFLAPKPAPRQPQRPGVDAVAGEDREGETPELKAAPDRPPPEAPQVDPVDDIVLGEPVAKPTPNPEYFLSATLTNQGAAVRDVHLNRYWDESRKNVFRIVHDENPDKPSYLLSVGVGKTLDETLKGKNWEVEKRSPSEVAFRTTAMDGKLAVRKRFLQAPGEVAGKIVLELTNTTEDELDSVYYKLTGANGLPVEGEWYTQYFRHAVFLVRPASGFPSLKEEYAESVYQRDRDGQQQAAFGVLQKQPLQYLGVADQYFASLVVQPKNALEQNRIAEGRPIVVSDGKSPRMTNISVELRSEPFKLKPGETVVHEYLLYNGPKDKKLLSRFDDLLLEEVIYYPGLFGVLSTGWISKPIVWILETLYSVVHDYGIAILLLTIIVRICLYPLTYHQNRMMMRMQAIQPLIQQIRDECGDDRKRAAERMQELMTKYKVNPFGGCLPMLLQLPIFVGLWQGLQNSFALRQAPFLFGWTWIHDLSAPDQLFRWPFQIGFIDHFLGPYFNLLPILATAQIILQMHYMSPPATTPEMQMQQRLMKIMMAFFGFLFYTVPSGLCIYIITSGLWGMAERKLMPKPKKPVFEGVPEPTASVNGQAAAKRDESWKRPVDRKKTAKK